MKPRVRVDLGIDARPELDRRLQLRGARKELLLRIGSQREKGESVGYR